MTDLYHGTKKFVKGEVKDELFLVSWCLGGEESKSERFLDSVGKLLYDTAA